VSCSGDTIYALSLNINFIKLSKKRIHFKCLAKKNLTSILNKNNMLQFSQVFLIEIIGIYFLI